jgi:membrane peptidoglycan carboxypeptidase
MERHAIPGHAGPAPRPDHRDPGGTLAARRLARSPPRIVRSLYLRLTLIVALAGLGLAVVGVALVPAALGLARADTATPTKIDLGPLDQRSYVFASDGSVLATLRAEVDRQPIPLKDIPASTVDAVLAVEDAQFFIHDGVNLRATLRALVHNVDAGQTVQGGSTLTQQIVKADIVGNERTVGRKAREAILARRLEQQMTKDQLLERYLNTVYFGNGAYGVQAAAETYFGIEAKALDDGQSAFLAGMIGSPTSFDPIRHPAASKARRHLALRRMVDQGVLSSARAAQLADAPLPDHVTSVLPTPDTYFVEEVKQQLLSDKRLGDTRGEREQALFRGGLRIFTTLDPKAERLAEQSRNDVLAGISPAGTPVGETPLAPDKKTGAARYATGAVVSVEPGTGAIRAMVGGPSFADEHANIATGRGTKGVGRSGGSTFKVFVLMALLENGYVPSDTVNGTSPCTFTHIPGLNPDPYTVENFGGETGSVGTITEQVLRSSNCAFVRLGQIVGIDEVIKEAKKMGITTQLENVASMPLGTEEVLPVDMAGAVATIAADGLHATPYYVDRVEDSSGKTIFRHKADVTRAASPQSARLAAQVLEANVRSGTGTRAQIPGQHAAGKTGTGQKSSDAWFVGFTPYLATAVWIGSPNDNSAVVIKGTGITGANYPAEIWGRYMRAWHAGLPDRDYPSPASTRGGRLLQLPPTVDSGGASPSSSSSSTTQPLFPGGSVPFPFPFPTSPPRPTPRTVPTSPTDTQDRFPPGFPFNN